MPRWVKIFLIVIAVLVVLLVAGMLISGGQHGPGRHLSSTGHLGVEIGPAAMVSETR